MFCMGATAAGGVVLGRFLWDFEFPPVGCPVVLPLGWVWGRSGFLKEPKTK